jgi:hypothetical protein
MHKVIPLPRLARDRSATAPYAVVAVIIMLGAGMSYAYLAHLQASRLHMDGLEPWSDLALDILAREEVHFRSAVDAALCVAVSAHHGASSVDLVSSIGRAGQGELDGWASVNYPSLRGFYSIEMFPPRFTLSTIYGTVTTGNVLGQQLPQRVPVGLEAVGAATLTVTHDSGAMASREVVHRIVRTEPMVLAAHLQNTLEYTLADEGLVPLLLSDGLRYRLQEDPGWEPKEGTVLQAVDTAIAIVERSLFHWETRMSWIWENGAETVSGPTAFGVDTQGSVIVQVPHQGRVTLENPRTGETQDVRMVPWVEWHGQEVEITTDSLWSAEAGGPGGAKVVRLDISGRFGHRVDVWRGDTMVGAVGREVQFRDHLVAWAENGSFASDGSRKMGTAQIEDWGDLRRTMDIVSPPVREVVVDISPDLGREVEVTLDGVNLGLVGQGEFLLTNVVAGRHQLMARSPFGTFSEEITVPSSGPTTVVSAIPQEVDTEAAYAFWFGLMSSLHRSGASPVAHLEHIAALTGYPPLPDHVRLDPRGRMEELTFWVEGLDHHLDFRGGAFDDRGADAPLQTWNQAKEVVSFSKLTYKMMVKLPKTVMQAGQVAIQLSDSGGRAQFIVRVQTASETLDLMEATEKIDGSCAVKFNLDGKVVVKEAGTVLSALSLLGKSLSIGFDLVDLTSAVEDGDTASIAWAVYELGVDLAQMVLSAVKFAYDMGVMALSQVTRSTMAVIGSAISVVATFLDAYRDAGEDFWGAWDLLLHPDGFGDALRTAGFLSALSSLITTVVVVAAWPALTGATVSWALLSMAVVAGTGVGLIVLAAVLAVWVFFHWDEVKAWVHGTADADAIDVVKKDMGSALDSTMGLMARLNTVDVEEELAKARVERGIGLAFMDLMSMAGEPGLVDALGGAAHYHLDGGSAQGRKARAIVEARHWTVSLWREVDDLVDGERSSDGGEISEGFPEDKGWAGKNHDYDADIRVIENGTRTDLDQEDIATFLRGLEPEMLDDLQVKLVIDGEVFQEALKEWMRALDAIGDMLSRATTSLSRASRESAYSASSVSEAAYDRTRGLVEIRMPAWVESAQVLVECTDGAVLVEGRPVEGPCVVEVTNGTALFAVTGRAVTSRVLSYDDGDVDGEIERLADCTAHKWFELSFGRSVLTHAEA